jgi:hypothetical protein
MRAVVRSVRFPHLQSGRQIASENGRELVEVLVGPSDGPGGESFCLTACTPAALVEVLAEQPVLVGRHWLFVAEFSPRVVEDFLRRRIEQIEGATWTEVAQKVGRLGFWEFEDYQPWTG